MTSRELKGKVVKHDIVCLAADDDFSFADFDRAEARAGIPLIAVKVKLVLLGLGRRIVSENRIELKIFV